MFKKLFGWGKKEKANNEKKVEEPIFDSTKNEEDDFEEKSISYEDILDEETKLDKETSNENSDNLRDYQKENNDLKKENDEISEEDFKNLDETFEIETEDLKDVYEIQENEEDLKEELSEKNQEEANEEIQEEVDEELKVETQEELKEEAKKEPKSFFARLKEGLSKTSKNFTEKITELFECYEGVSELVYEDLEEILIMADVGYETTTYIVETLRKRVLDKSISDTKEVRIELQQIISQILSKESAYMNIDNGPSIVTVVGVNGVGKTTTIGKLANKYKLSGKKVILAAADTFRAAASEQLEIWSKRADVEIVKHKEGADPSAVIFDGIKAAKARGADILICDTAGRLHNKKNLMMELEKIFRIIDREYEEANKEVLLVIDATTGQNAINQAKLFKEAAPLTGIILTKLDGTAKGGVVLGIIQELGLPVKYVGVGEKLDDLQEFDSKAFSKALFGED